MTKARFNRYWVVVVVFLAVIIIVTGFVAWSKYRPAKPIEVIFPAKEETIGNIYIDGAVNNSGIYHFSEGDTIASLIQSAGGVTADGDSGNLKLTVRQTDTPVTSQKININTAEAWLLEALPGIGSTRAKAIIDYRQKNGLFRNINELLKVDGISSNLLEQIKLLIIVSD